MLVEWGFDDLGHGFDASGDGEFEFGPGTFIVLLGLFCEHFDEDFGEVAEEVDGEWGDVG